MAAHARVTLPPLDAVRYVVGGADELLLGVAFVHARGVNLIARQLPRHGRRRLVATTAFGTTTIEGIAEARRTGFDVRVLNPASSTFHPKVYLARHGDEVRAVVGSANLTGGLVSNVESTVVLTGPSTDEDLTHLWTTAEGWWTDPRSLPPEDAQPARPERLSPDLYRRIEAVVSADEVIPTVSDGKPNRIVAITYDGVYVDTDRSQEPQLVPAWMLTVAWEHLTSTGEITNRFLLADDGLNVKRSSFVCALLAQLTDVEVVSRRPIQLRLRPEWAPDAATAAAP